MYSCTCCATPDVACVPGFLVTVHKAKATGQRPQQRCAPAPHPTPALLSARPWASRLSAPIVRRTAVPPPAARPARALPPGTTHSRETHNYTPTLGSAPRSLQSHFFYRMLRETTHSLLLAPLRRPQLALWRSHRMGRWRAQHFRDGMCAALQGRHVRCICAACALHGVRCMVCAAWCALHGVRWTCYDTDASGTVALGRSFQHAA